MPNIQVLDQITIDKIAAGEVIERPASVVKELVENAMDAGASVITVEIQEGGIALIRVTDDGCGIPGEEVPSAFLRHSTSKIRTIDDLTHIHSLGFRGEALSSIAAVAQVELKTKRKEDEAGTRYVIEGGAEKKLEVAGVPDGTTFLVRQLFYNIPARRKFLKTAVTEASHIHDLMMRMALSHPEISFCFISNNQEKIRTSGNGKVKDVIYQLYGRDVAANLIETTFSKGELQMKGFLGKPVICRGNRNFENYYINGRYIRNAAVSKSIEDAYKDFMMQHKFPFVVLYFTMPPEEIDVNVHPAKMEIRFHRQQEVYQFVFEGVHRFLTEPELIPDVKIDEENSSTKKAEKPVETRVFDRNSVNKSVENVDNSKQSVEIKDEAYFIRKMRERVMAFHSQNDSAEVEQSKVYRPEIQMDRIRETVRYADKTEHTLGKRESTEDKTECTLKNPTCDTWKTERTLQNFASKSEETKPIPENDRQLDLFEEKFLEKSHVSEYKIIGQAFDTYWIVEFHDNLYIIDQHAAHERVLYEKTLCGMKTREYTSQLLSPPLILSLTMQEAETLESHMDRFAALGFEIEPFGGDAYAVRAVPANLFSIAKKELFLEMLDQMADGITTTMTPDLIDEKIASMSCKAAVKGNQKLSLQEAQTLISELLELENPYHCPHGRPTIISMTKRELEKKFKRIV